MAATCRTGGPTGPCYSSAVGQIGEGSIAVVVIKRTASVAGDKEIVVTVVVKVADCDAGGISHADQPRLFGHVFEGTIGLLVVEAVPVFRIVFLGYAIDRHGISNVRTVREEDVEPPIVVVVEQGDAGPHRLEKIFLACRRRLLPEVDA